MTEPNQAILSIDYGSKRIGLAYCAQGQAVVSLPVLENRGPEFVAADLAKQVRQRQCQTVVVGLPLHMNGRESPMVAEIRTVMAKMNQRLAPNAVAIIEHDERLTSWNAEKNMLNQGQKPWQDKGQIDTRAALLLLQDYLSDIDPRANLLSEPPELQNTPIFLRGHTNHQTRHSQNRRNLRQNNRRR